MNNDVGKVQQASDASTLIEALRPFAVAAAAFSDATPDQFELLIKIDATPMFRLRVGDFRRAQAALSERGTR